MHSWLPELITLQQCNGDWEKYLDVIYTAFKEDFIDSKPVYEKRVGLKRKPVTKGKEVTFWHFISSGDDEEEREPDMRRCERILWPKALIESCSTDKVYVWHKPKGKAFRVLIALKDFSYVVILDDRGDYVLPWTAYCVNRMHMRNKLRKEFETYKTARAATS